MHVLRFMYTNKKKYKYIYIYIYKYMYIMKSQKKSSVLFSRINTINIPPTIDAGMHSD